MRSLYYVEKVIQIGAMAREMTGLLVNYIKYIDILIYRYTQMCNRS